MILAYYAIIISIMLTIHMQEGVCKRVCGSGVCSEAGEMMEKYCEKNKSVYLAFLDLEKAYYRVDRRERGKCCKCMLEMACLE